MSYSISEYLQLLLNLLPRGKAWSRQPDGGFYNLMYGHAAELNRVDLRTEELQREIDTRYTSELLTDHETDLGLPDDCITEVQSLLQRVTNVHVKFIEEGGLHAQSYIDMASDLGYEITITETTPAWAGIAVAGDPCGGQGNIFTVGINVTLSPDDWVYFTSGGSQCGDLLVAVADTSTLQCILTKFRPAHITLYWTYTGYAFSGAFGPSFNAIPSDDEAYLAGAFDRAFGTGFYAYYSGGDFDYEEFGSSFYKPL